MSRICIVATYFQRQQQLNKTLLSLLSSAHTNFEVVIVDDGSKDDITLPDLSFKVTKIKSNQKLWTNPEPAYNTGILYALAQKPDIIILQNAENYHVGDVISYAEKVTPESYISFGCYSIDQENTFKDHDIHAIISQNNVIATGNGQNAWYNHPEIRPVGYDFCSAITADNIRLLNGYDERFSAGCAYGDDNLLSRIKKLGLKIEITVNPFVVHQWHYDTAGVSNHAELCVKNNKLFIELDRENIIRAKHNYTPDL